jgi:hypothetical protein
MIARQPTVFLELTLIRGFAGGADEEGARGTGGGLERADERGTVS